MAKQIKMRGLRRKEIDEEKLALAFLLLAKIIADEQDAPVNVGDLDSTTSESDMVA